MAAVLTLGEAQDTLRRWMAALDAASNGQAYSIGGRSLTRQDIPTIRAEIQRWHNTVTALEQEAAGRQRPLGAQASFAAPGQGTGGLIPGSLWVDGRT